ncbi:hypothetical protein E6C27_scaffold243G001710 [Cucumis melo var. makuwa]|uniref:Uncharacterized protein n=1 Tax=Cucumis melo var. makuwa TaxID=1194695 RepID=A0A5A7TUY8_CUCMM|nr:hypothetical protein E6C27_scaffold243G001710 [Cucumis melo var. makuwa]
MRSILISFYLYSVVPWAPGGSKFTRNPIPPAGDEMVRGLTRVDDDKRSSLMCKLE